MNKLKGIENKKLFLDIDGVLTTLYESMDINTTQYWKEHPWSKTLNVQYPFNSDCVKIINNILEETNSDIILTSDWKKNGTIEQLDIIFKNNDVIKSPISTTPDYSGKYSNIEYLRSIEIIHYIVDNNINIDDIVVIDDLDLGVFFPPRLKNRFIKTIDGITEDDEIKILKLLK